MTRVATLDEQITECAEAYERAVWRSQLSDADAYWTRLCNLRAQRDRTLTPAQLRAVYGQTDQR